MSIIESYFKSVNENSPNSAPHFIKLGYLDDNFPNWRTEIKNKEEWKATFEFDICITPGYFMFAFANELFDTIDNPEAEMFVWNNKNCKDFYRIAAVQRLIKTDQATYLPQYIDELKNGKFNFGVLGFFLLGYLFDFPAAEDVALEMYAAGLEEADLAFSYLAKVAHLHWDKYPESLKDKIVDKGPSAIHENISKELWSKLSLMHKIQLVYTVVTEEIKTFHNANAISQCYDNGNTTRTMFFGNGAEWDIYNDMKSGDGIEFKRLLLKIYTDPRYYEPGVDIDTNQYTPSGRISRFIEASEGDTVFNSMLRSVVSDIKKGVGDYKSRVYIEKMKQKK